MRAAGVVGQACSGVAEALEQQGLGEDGAPELHQVEPLVRAVRAGVGVLDAGDEDARAGERLLGPADPERSG